MIVEIVNALFYRVVFHLKATKGKTRVARGEARREIMEAKTKTLSDTDAKERL